MLMVVLRLLSVRASQVCYLTDHSRFPRRCIFGGATSERDGVLLIVFVGGQKALRR